MSNPANERPKSAAADTRGLMSSIAAVREILMMNSVAESEAVKDLQAHKQKTYEEKVRLEQEIEKQRALVEELQSKVEQAQEEVQREKLLRETMEASHSALEEHKKELLVQLELVKESRAALESKLSEFRDDLDKENDAFGQEREKWEALVGELRSQNEKTRNSTGQLEAQLLASRRQKNELEARLASMKEELESNIKRHEETIQGYINVNAQLKKRIELGSIDTIENLQTRLQESEAARDAAIERMRRAQTDNHTFQQSLSSEESKKLKERKEAIAIKVESLQASLQKASKDLSESEEAVARHVGDASKEDDLLIAKEDLGKKIEAAGDIWKQLEEVYGEQLELAKVEADKASIDLVSVRERWQGAKSDVTKAQAEVERCQSERVKLQEKSSTKKRATEQTSNAAKRQKQN
eukprot:scaffold7987_cov200-Cylindrotheca_fusiformis.AAC.11